MKTTKRYFKTYNHLRFEKHSNSEWFNLQARMNFRNGYGISVINGEGANSGRDTYEIAVTYKGILTYRTPITNDVLGYQTAEDVTKIMKQIQKL